MSCSEYYIDYIDEDNPRELCRCPMCKGWLPRSLPDGPFACKKCGVELMLFPDDEDVGRICQISDTSKEKKTE